ncbi:MAG: hypothetical protein IJ594_00210, partial [Oscillospiraceae bacterium]|nr:hypothetical protein [Oscillospiraceae bacterium]
HETSNVAALQSHLQEAGVHYVDLYAALADGPVRYYRTDSHWTAQGAAIAADRLLAAAGVASDYVEGPFAVDGTRRGDLYEMLYPAAAGAENEVLYAGMLGYETRSDPNDGNAITIETDRDGAQGGLLCWRDSFGVALYPYLADSFGHAVFSRAAVYDFTKYDPQEYDVVLIEIVERNLPRLAEDCAVFSTD